MYQITVNNSSFIVDDIKYVKLHKENGSYVLCVQEEAEGICVKVPKEIETEDGAILSTCEDTVYTIGESTMNGTEEKCTFEKAQIAMEYYEALKAKEILTMLEEVL